jgi:hypothetical protein
MRSIPHEAGHGPHGRAGTHDQTGRARLSAAASHLVLSGERDLLRDRFLDRDLFRGIGTSVDANHEGDAPFFDRQRREGAYQCSIHPAMIGTINVN